MESFEAERRAAISNMAQDAGLRRLSQEWLCLAQRHRYSYNFDWLGRPIIQYPQDIVALQEIVWRVEPDLIIETGIARGGSLIFYASLLELLGGDRRVIGIDIDLQPPNRQAIQAHRFAKRITVLDGSSVDPAVVRTVRKIAAGYKRVLVVLDSLHTHEHVLAELDAYADLVKPPSYLVVLDTIIEDLPEELSADRPWGRGNNPKTAVRAFLQRCARFQADRELEAKLLFSVAPGGYLRCVRE